MASSPMNQALPTLLASRRTQSSLTCSGNSSNFQERDRCHIPADDHVAGETKSLRIKNTFIDTSEEMSAFEQFHQERQVHTCPSNQIGRVRETLQQLIAESAVDDPRLTQPHEETYVFGDSPCPSPAPRWDRCFLRQSLPETVPLPSYLASPKVPMSQGVQRPVLSISDALVGGSTELGQAFHGHALALRGHALPPRVADNGYCYSAPSSAAVSQMHQQEHFYAAPVMSSMPSTSVSAAVGPRTDASSRPCVSAASLLGLVQEQHRLIPAACATARLPSAALAASAPAAAVAPPLPAAPAPAPFHAPVPAPPAQPAPGSVALPSMGSLSHQTGRCKPCAFFHTVGCENSALCQFCHLCEAGEKQRRRKERLEMRRMARKVRQSSPSHAVGQVKAPVAHSTCK
mmetsp:Transcript_105010/g.266733  ORF Transcript_105010/g.266733 Transcript_105010/m.266733 type:complete len:402 (-) Transcript_105010:107-1312(-)